MSSVSDAIPLPFVGSLSSVVNVPEQGTSLFGLSPPSDVQHVQYGPIASDVISLAGYISVL